LLAGCDAHFGTSEPFDLSDSGQRLATADSLSPEQARQQLAGHDDRKDRRVMKTDMATSHWHELALPACSDPGGCVLTVPMATFDEVDLWLYRGDRLLEHYSAGDARPFAVRPLADARFSFPVSAGEGVTALLRVRTGGYLNFRILWATADNYRGDVAARAAWYGMLFGSLGIMALFNFFVFLGLRDRNFLYYSAYVTSLALFLSVFTGHAAQFLWPGSDGLSNTMIIIAPCLSVIFGLAFCFGFLREAQFKPLVRRFGAGLSAVAAAFIVLEVAGAPYEPLILATSVLAYAALLTYLMLALSAWRAGLSEARFLLLAFTSFFVGMVVHQLRVMALIPSTDFTAHAAEAGVLLEATLLAFALADRINLLNAKNRRLERQALEAQRTFSRQIVSTQERERETISRALHDSVGHGLLIVKNHLLANGRTRGEPEAADRSATDREMAEQCSEILNTVRDLSHALHPHILERLGLAKALESIFDRTVSSTDISGCCSVEDCDEDLTHEAKLTLYRVAQESLSNAIKHGQPSEILLDLRREGDTVMMRIKDDGNGFDPDSTKPGLGLVNMRGRLQLVGGQLELQSAPDRGCELRCELPVSSLES
jgi:signal transduction histidine kinase